MCVNKFKYLIIAGGCLKKWSCFSLKSRYVSNNLTGNGYNNVLDAGRTKTKSKLSSCLIDKSLSIDEDELCTPLQPTLVRIFHLDDSNFSSSITSEDTSSEEDDGIEDFVHIEVDKKPLIHQLAYKDAGKLER